MGKGLLNKLVLQNLFEDVDGKDLLESLVASGVITNKDIEGFLARKSNIKDGVLVRFDERDLDSEGEYLIPRDVKIIGNAAFEGCKKLTKVKLHNGVVEIRPNAFWECSNLESVSMTDSVIGIGFNAFAYCVNLKDINLSSKVQIVKHSTFAACVRLENIKLPENLKRIEQSAFYFCGELTDINIPKGLEYLDEEAFLETPIEKSVMREFKINRRLLEQSKGVNNRGEMLCKN